MKSEGLGNLISLTIILLMTSRSLSRQGQSFQEISPVPVILDLSNQMLTTKFCRVIAKHPLIIWLHQTKMLAGFKFSKPMNKMKKEKCPHMCPRETTTP